MSKPEWLSKPLWSTAVVAALLSSGMGTAIATTLYLSNRFAAVEVRMTALENKFEASEKIAEIRKQYERLQFTRKEEE